MSYLIKKHRAIILFTAPVRSGKTTALMKWTMGRPHLGGVLAPDVDGLRTIFTLRDRKTHPFQLSEQAIGAGGEEVVRVGRFCFLASALEMVRKTLLEDSHRAFDWLLIDEIGKLEMEGMGYEPAAGEVIGLYNRGEVPGKLLLVVRSPLLEGVVEKYRLQNYQVVQSTEHL